MPRIEKLRLFREWQLHRHAMEKANYLALTPRLLSFVEAAPILGAGGNLHGTQRDRGPCRRVSRDFGRRRSGPCGNAICKGHEAICPKLELGRRNSRKRSELKLHGRQFWRKGRDLITAISSKSWWFLQIAITPCVDGFKHILDLAPVVCDGL